MFRRLWKKWFNLTEEELRKRALEDRWRRFGIPLTATNEEAYEMIKAYNEAYEVYWRWGSKGAEILSLRRQIAELSRRLPPKDEVNNV